MKIEYNILIKVENTDVVDGTINLPEGLTKIDYCAFCSCLSLTSINLPEGLTKIDYGAFQNCTSLTSINLPEGLKEIGNCAFWNCISLTSINLPEGLKEIGDWVFWNCTSLTSINHKPVKCVDGTIFEIKSQKSYKDYNIYKGNNFKYTDELFVAEKDGFFAHGKTLKKAISDVNFKILSEKIKKDPIKKSDWMTIEKYRIITGACEIGVKNWMEENKIDQKRIKVGKLMEILKKTNAWGWEKVESLISL